ncbi:porin family protein [Prevotella sp.]|uniref:porin family protein n=1 Tax=Prevotella sp. TaxID=59823 RepID=UPI003DA386EA
MKKQLMFLAALLMTASSVCAQQKAGTFSITPKIGVTASNFSGKMPLTVAYAISTQMSPSESGVFHTLSEENFPEMGAIGFNESKNKFGFTAGVETQYQFSKIIGLSLGVFYTQQGASYDTKGYSYTSKGGVKVAINDNLKVNLNCITMPILANVYIWKGLAVKAGLQPELAVSKKTSCDVVISYHDPSVSVVRSGVEIKSFSLSVPVGVSYEYKNIVADLRYNIGVTDLRKDGDAGWNSDFSSTSKNRTLLFTVGYKFEL